MEIEIELSIRSQIRLTHDSVPRVRAASIHVLTRALSLVGSLPASDCSVFPEYVLPELAPRATDAAQAPRIALANNIGERLGNTVMCLPSYAP